MLDALDDVMDRGLDLDVEVTFTAPRARSRRCVLSLRALTDEGGGVTGAIGCLIDITEDVTLREELEQRVRYDPLTGCLNRASVLAELEERLAAAGQDQAIVVAFVDLDDFKAINDQYGHPAGDSVLKHVATRLRQVGGDEGLVGRLGGDEFLVVLPARGPSDAPGSLADGIRAALHAPIRLGPQWIVPRADASGSRTRSTLMRTPTASSPWPTRRCTSRSGGARASRSSPNPAAPDRSAPHDRLPTTGSLRAGAAGPIRSGGTVYAYR